MNSIYKFPLDLYQRVVSVFKWKIYRKSVILPDFLHALPPQVRIDLCSALYKKELENILFFKEKGPKFIAFLGPLMNANFHLDGELIYSKNDVANDMFFIKSGSCSLVVEEFDNFPYIRIEKGYYFGETELLFSNTRNFTVIANEPTQLLFLNKANFEKTFFNEFPQIGREVYNNAIKRRMRQFKGYYDARKYCERVAELERQEIQWEMKIQTDVDLSSKKNFAPAESNVSNKSIESKSLLQSIFSSNIETKKELLSGMKLNGKLFLC